MTLQITTINLIYLIISSTPKHLISETLRANLQFAKYHSSAKETSDMTQSKEFFSLKLLIGMTGSRVFADATLSVYVLYLPLFYNLLFSVVAFISVS